MTKPTKWVCAQRRLWLAWASAQSDQSLRCPHEETLGPLLPIERKAKTLIRLGGCPGWSESSLGAHSFCSFCHVVAHLCLVKNVQSMGIWESLKTSRYHTNVICYSTEYITVFLYKWSYIIQAAWSSIHSQCRMYLKRKCTLNADGSAPHYFGQINRSQNSIVWFLSFVTEKDNLIIWLLNFRPGTRQPRTSQSGIDCHNKAYRLPVMLLISSPL